MTLPGGPLLVEWREDDHVWMTGPVETEFEGAIDPETLAWTVTARARRDGWSMIVTFGCRLNALESEVMRQRAEAAGLGDAVLVNTCAVTAEAVRQARQAIRRARREQPGREDRRLRLRRADRPGKLCGDARGRSRPRQRGEADGRPPIAISASASTRRSASTTSCR